MFTFDLGINLANLNVEDIRYQSENLLIYLGANSQIINRDHQFILEGNQIANAGYLSPTQFTRCPV